MTISDQPEIVPGRLCLGRTAKYEIGVGVILTATVILLLVSFQYSASRVLVFCDEAIELYLMHRPDTPYVTMDHAVFGRLMAHFDWTVVHLKWLSLAFLLTSFTALAAAARPWFPPETRERLAWKSAVALGMLGVWFYYVAGMAQVLNYYTISVSFCNFFAAVVLASLKTGGARRAVVLLLAGSLCLAFIFLSRMPEAAFLLVFSGMVYLVAGKRVSVTLGYAALVVLTTVAWLGVFHSAGYDYANHFKLLSVLAGAINQLKFVLARNLFQLIKVLIGGMILTSGYGMLIWRLRLPHVYGWGVLFMLAVILFFAIVPNVHDFIHGYVVTSDSFLMTPHVDFDYPFAHWPRSFGVMYGCVATALLYERLLRLLSVRYPFLRRAFPAPVDLAAAWREVARFVFFFGICLLPFTGSNGGFFCAKRV
ncbi:MAG: hypothetical protein HQL37_03780 [Alphaproteobacteria bacterium]|nr:hypothetical protein [Alphaproteobacteria bacterium]